MLVDLAYAMVVERLGPEQRKDFDEQLAELAPKPEMMVSVTNRHGQVIQISQARLARIRANAANVRSFQHKGKGR